MNSASSSPAVASVISTTLRFRAVLTQLSTFTGFAYFGREPYSYIQRVEKRYQFTDNFSWSIGRHDTKFGGDFNYLPLQATFTVNYGGVYDFGSQSLFPNPFPVFNAVQAYGLGIPGDFIQGLGSPSDSFKNKSLGLFWQDSWRVRHNLTLNLGLRYDVEFPPTFKPPQGLALPAYNALGLQKGIQTDKNNFQPRFGLAWDPSGDGKTVIRASYGIFYDHPLLGLYFLGDASDGSSSGQLAFAGTGFCSGAGSPANLNGIPIFQGNLINPPRHNVHRGIFPQANTNLFYEPDQQQFQSLNTPNSVFLNQNYLNLAEGTFLPLGFQPFGYPQAKNFVYAYSQQANLTVERDLGKGYALSLGYNLNLGRHLNRPINTTAVRGDLMASNFFAALAAGSTATSPFTVSGCGPGYVDPALMNFFRPGGLNPSIAAGFYASGDPAKIACVFQAQALLANFPGFNTKCNPVPPTFDYTNCIPFGDMDANYSNGTSNYNGLTLTSASVSAITTSSWRPTPGHMQSTTRLTCNQRSRRRTATFQVPIVRLPLSTSAIVSSSAAFTRPASSVNQVSSASFSAIGRSPHWLNSVPGALSTSLPVLATISNCLALPGGRTLCRRAPQPAFAVIKPWLRNTLPLDFSRNRASSASTVLSHPSTATSDAMPERPRGPSLMTFAFRSAFSLASA